MLPDVLALADSVNKQVVVVEYDPMKLNNIEELYNEDRRKKVIESGFYIAILSFDRCKKIRITFE